MGNTTVIDSMLSGSTASENLPFFPPQEVRLSPKQTIRGISLPRSADNDNKLKITV